MADRPAFHCGSDNCCEGEDYPECQAVASVTTALIDFTDDGELEIVSLSRDFPPYAEDGCDCN